MGWGGADNTPGAEVEPSRDNRGRDNEPWHGLATRYPSATRYPLYDDPAGPSTAARAKAAGEALQHFPHPHPGGVRCRCGKLFYRDEHPDTQAAWAAHYAAILVPERR